MNFRGYQGLAVWNRAVDLVAYTYRITETLRGQAAPELLSGMRRMSLSIPSQLAAGYQTSSCHDYLRYVHAAQIDLARMESQVTTLTMLGWATDDDVADLQGLMTHLDHLLTCLERYLAGHDAEVALQPK